MWRGDRYETNRTPNETSEGLAMVGHVQFSPSLCKSSSRQNPPNCKMLLQLAASKALRPTLGAFPGQLPVTTYLLSLHQNTPSPAKTRAKAKSFAQGSAARLSLRVASFCDLHCAQSGRVTMPTQLKIIEVYRVYRLYMTS